MVAIDQMVSDLQAVVPSATEDVMAKQLGLASKPYEPAEKCARQWSNPRSCSTDCV
jgi:hypothetical protein